MAPPKVPVQFVAKGEYGDFAWMIQQHEYVNALFVFSDVIEFMDSMDWSNGNAWIRPHTMNNPEIIIPQAANVPIGSIHHGGFSSLDTATQEYIDDAIEKIQTLSDTDNYNVIYFAADDDNKIAVNNYIVSPTVRNYITSAINNIV
jgi:hypothetical protein